MDHSKMDHSHMMGHGDMDHGDSGAMCNINMLFTWDTDKLCIVFKWWRVTSTLSLVVSLVAVMAIVAGYEALREGIRQYEAWVNKRAETAIRQGRPSVTNRAHIIKSVLYGIQNFYAFMIMLIFMTYNGWLMIAVSVGAGLGYLLFGARTTAAKTTACH